MSINKNANIHNKSVYYTYRILILILRLTNITRKMCIRNSLYYTEEEDNNSDNYESESLHQSNHNNTKPRLHSP